MMENTQVAILSRAIAPDANGLSTEAAQSILNMRLTEPDRARMSELGAKARAGTLTAQEEKELDNYVHVADLLTLLHAKARQSLKLVSAVR